MKKEIHELLKIQNDETTIYTNKELKMIDDYINELELLQRLFKIENDYINKLEKENKILRENAEHNDKVVDKVNWENLKLKKELEEANEKILLLQASEPMLEYKKALEENHQKEFIEF